MTHAYTNRVPGRRRGLSLVEVVISLAISASLLTAVATAFHASGMAIEANDRVARATQTARVTLLHLLHDVRLGTVAEDFDQTDEMTVVVLDPNGNLLRDRTFRLVGTELRMYTNDDPSDDVGGVPGSYVLCRNVASLTFHKDPAQAENGTTLVGRVAVTLTVNIDRDGDGQGDGVPISLSGTASPRKHLTY